MVERRSPIRRVSGRFSKTAGSETGAPGAVIDDLRFDLRAQA
jgi:hypothetical protein